MFLEVKELGKTHCPLCEEKLDPYATYPFNREGSFSCFWHSACMEKVARWFRAKGHRIDFNNKCEVKLNSSTG